MFNSIYSTTCSILNKLIGLDYYRYRVVFYHNDLEIAFVSDSLMGSTRTYINGDQVSHSWPPLSDFYGNTRFTRDGVSYRIRHHMTNLLSCAQKISLFADGAEVQSKTDARFANLRPKQILHMSLGLMGFGLLIGFLLKAIGI